LPVISVTREPIAKSPTTLAAVLAMMPAVPAKKT